MPLNKGGIIRYCPLFMTNMDQWITQQRLTLIRVCLFWYHLIGQECIDPMWWIKKLIIQVNLLIQLECNTCGSTNKSPTKLNAAENKVDAIICFWIRKTSKEKPLPGDFKVTTPKNPLLSQQAVTSKRISVPYTNLQLNSYSNTQLDLFCSDNLSFSMHDSQYMTNQSIHGSKYATNHQLEKDVGYIVLQFINTMKIMKLLGYNTLQRTNAIAS